MSVGPTDFRIGDTPALDYKTPDEKQMERNAGGMCPHVDMRWLEIART